MSKHRHRYRQIEESKLAALLDENIRLRSLANKIWLRWYFVPLLFFGAFASAFFGALIGS